MALCERLIVDARAGWCLLTAPLCDDELPFGTIPDAIITSRCRQQSVQGRCNENDRLWIILNFQRSAVSGDRVGSEGAISEPR